MMRTLFSLIALTLLLTSTAAQSTRLYKWTDDKGHVYYGQTKPTEFEFMEVNAPPPPPIDSPDLNKPYADQIRGKTTEPAGSKTKQATSSADDRAAKCKIARENLTALQTNPRIRVANPDGSASIMSEETRQQKLTESKKQIDYYCK